ncbi:MAG: glycosyltransferase involved in cell wall biosynthesis [Paraglaciecola sp.]|jgi:glycosyltransferase involved in cell wall biosynthesis
MNQPLITTIVAVRNGEQFLRDALDSILASDYPNVEIVLIDGGSTDGTAAIAQSYPQVKYFAQEGKGIPDAYNQGVSEANGEWIAFLSHDDRWLPKKLSLQAQYLSENEDHQLVVCRIQYFLETGCQIPSGFRPELLEGDHVAKIMETLLVRKNLFEEVGVFDTRYDIGEDVDWYARVQDAGFEVPVLPEVLVHKRVHDHNSSIDVDKNNVILLQVIRESIKRKQQQRDA